jgi:hypothetical protein
MKNLIKRHLDGRIIFVLFILTSVIYTIMLTVTIPKVMNFAGGMKLLDMIPTGYNAAYVETLFNALGEKGRHAYLFIQIPVDMIYPALFAVTYCLVTAYFLKILGKAESNLFYACLFPLFSGLFDYCENIGIITMLNTYPEISNITALTTNVCSVLKSSLTTISFILLIILLISMGIRKIFGKD